MVPSSRTSSAVYWSKRLGPALLRDPEEGALEVEARGVRDDLLLWGRAVRTPRHASARADHVLRREADPLRVHRRAPVRGVADAGEAEAHPAEGAGSVQAWARVVIASPHIGPGQPHQFARRPTPSCRILAPVAPPRREEAAPSSPATTPTQPIDLEELVLGHLKPFHQRLPTGENGSATARALLLGIVRAFVRWGQHRGVVERGV